MADETAWDAGLACGGQIEFFVEPLEGAEFAALRIAIETVRPYSIASHPIRDEVPEAWRHAAPLKWRQDLVQTMQKMKSRGILKEQDPKWSIVF